MKKCNHEFVKHNSVFPYCKHCGKMRIDCIYERCNGCKFDNRLFCSRKQERIEKISNCDLFEKGQGFIDNEIN